MKYGMNLLLWSPELGDELLPVVDLIAEIGYDGIEAPLFNLDLDYAAWGRRLDERGLQRTAVTVRGPEDNPISPEASIRNAAVEATKRSLDCCASLGATHLVGPIHSALGEFTGRGPTEDEWKWGVETLQRVSEYAAEVNVTLGVECLNRFEVYFLNTHADAARFAADVGHPNCRVMYDTFHANIEEKSVADAIQSCASHLCHVHISENDRSTPGRGAVKWDENFDALRAVDYDGWMTIEAFGTAMPELVAATKIWRRMYQSEEQLAREGLAFMREQVSKRW